MREWKGLGGAPGLVMGAAHIIPRRVEMEQNRAEDVETELNRLAIGRRQYMEGLRALAAGAGGEQADILNAYLAIAGDEGFFEEAGDLVRQKGMSAAAALEQKRAEAERLFLEVADDYLRGRADDVNNVCREITREMQGEARAIKFPAGEEGVVLFAEDLTPVETLRMDSTRLRGLVTERGGLSSHTVILAKSLGIPAVVGVGSLLGDVEPGMTALVNGESGRVVLSPDEAAMAAFAREKAESEKRQAVYDGAAGKPARTKDGAHVEVYVNTGDAKGAAALDFGSCDGVGLYRTEFLYLGRADYPGEETQYVAYRDIARRAAGKPVIIRTLDVGADKQAAYMGLEKEENPALGQRGIRRSLEDRVVFAIQLRAILRAGAEGDVRVMFPMVAGVEELRAARELLRQAAAQLGAEGVPHRRDMPVGIMVETPAAALLADHLARECNFFSIGTNDLTQYITAADRMNERVQAVGEVCSVPVLRAVWETCRAAAGAGIPVGICGEAAGEPHLVPLWVAMGMAELSVSPALVGRTKYLVANTDREAAAAALQYVLQCRTVAEVKDHLAGLVQGMGVQV